MTIENPKWNDRKDKKLYNELFYHHKRKLTEQEEKFVTKMYHYEEYFSGLDEV